MRASTHKFSQKVLGEAGVRLIATLFVLLLARALGAEDFGRYSTALAYAALCVVFVDLGTNSILTREIARHPENQISIAESSHFLKMTASLISWLLLLAVTYLLHFSSDLRYVTLCLGVVVIGQTLTEYFSALLSGMEEMGWEAVLKIASRVLAFSWAFVDLVTHHPLHVIVTHLAIGTAFGYAFSVLIIKSRFSSFGIRMNPHFLKFLLLSSLPLFGSVIFWILYDSQDILLLNYFHFAQRDIGWFSAANKIIDVTRVYPVLMMGVFFPTLSKLHLSDPLGFDLKKRRILLFMTGSLMLLASGIYFLAPWIIQILYKNDFAPASGFLRLLVPTLVLMGLNHAHIQFLIALNRERQLLTAALIVCVSNFLLACLFLPRFGVPGTCYALFGSEAAYFLFLRHALNSKS